MNLEVSAAEYLYQFKNKLKEAVPFQPLSVVAILWNQISLPHPEQWPWQRLKMSSNKELFQLS